MVIYTAKLTKTKMAVFIGGVFLLVLLIIVAVSALKNPTAESASIAASVEISYKNIKDNAGRVSFLNAFGWEISTDPIAIEEVVIPKEFDDVYTQYNEMQQFQGLDLTKYRGKTVKRYTYEVYNYPTGEEGVMANLLIYKNRVIGGDVCSSKYAGFMHGFERIGY